MKMMLVKPMRIASGNAATRPGASENRSIATPNKAEPTTTSRTSTVRRRAVSSAPVSEPIETTE